MNAPQSPSEPASDPRRLWAALGCVEPADWSHAAVVGRVPCLELDWRQHAKRGVSTLSVMEDLEPLDCHGLPADLGRSPVAGRQRLAPACPRAGGGMFRRVMVERPNQLEQESRHVIRRESRSAGLAFSLPDWQGSLGRRALRFARRPPVA